MQARADVLQAELDLMLNAVYEDIVITDGQGVVLQVSNSVERQYNISRGDLVGQSVAALEARKIFNPSVTMRVLKERSRQRLLQETPLGKKVLITGIPVFADDGSILRVFSYAHDVTELIELREHTADLEHEMNLVKQELEQLRQRALNVDGLVVASAEMRRYVRMAAHVAERDVPVLLLGESGVGKGVLARFIHQHSKRSGGPFIEISCGAIPETLVESELFGYSEGTFTGGLKAGKVGLLELANDGTLFLDEIGELTPSMQVKLLKTIHEKTFLPVGGRSQKFSNFRVVAATNRDLEAMVAKGEFRADLYFRLNIVPLKIPPLRDRPEDILELTDYFVHAMNDKHGLNKRLSPGVLQRFLQYTWPGNVRELENMVERLIVLAEGETIAVGELPPHFDASRGVYGEANLGVATLPELLATFERQILSEARQRCRTTTEMAELLGVSQPTVVRRLQKYFPS